MLISYDTNIININFTDAIRYAVFANFRYYKALQDASENTIQESEETTVAFEIKVESDNNEN